jgi:hypothetical protein
MEPKPLKRLKEKICGEVTIRRGRCWCYCYRRRW